MLKKMTRYQIIKILEKSEKKYHCNCKICEATRQAIKILKDMGNCICMDCGKTIKVIDQSKHKKICKRKDISNNVKYERPKKPAAIFLNRYGKN